MSSDEIGEIVGTHRGKIEMRQSSYKSQWKRFNKKVDMNINMTDSLTESIFNVKVGESLISLHLLLISSQLLFFLMDTRHTHHTKIVISV